MFKKITFLLILLIYSNSFGQVFINELDSDTPGTDIKEFIELKSTTPNLSLSGYVLVFFNSSDNKSYLTFDLDNYTTNSNGIFTIGNSAVSPVPNLFLTNNSIQNGPDAVAIYLANGSNFPTGTLATSTNLVNAIAHGTNDANAINLMNLLNLTSQQDEGANNLSQTQSIQRKNDGTYETKEPTSGANNDGSGVVFNGISITISPVGNVVEGNTFNITFSTQTIVTANLNFSFSLTNGNFNTADYTTNLNVVIAAGTSTAQKNVLIVDDILVEGDENLKISVGTIPSNFIKLNDNIIVRVNDNDNLVQPWGTPLVPTFGQVTSTMPAGYYNSLNGKSGAALKQAIQDIIANPAVIREYTYGDVYDILQTADQNPANSSQVWLMYVEQGRSKIDNQTGSSGAVGFWNREHIYPQSRGGFSDGTSSFSGNINTWLPTDANDILAGHSDAHHIRAEDSPENSVRSNRNYGVDYNGTIGNQSSWKGDVARAVFYMCVRYNGLNVVNGNPSETPNGFIGDLSTLLAWNLSDAADDFEMNRNNYIYTWQKNRNPFIDYPQLANYVFGNQIGQIWNPNLSDTNYRAQNIVLYPNPTTNYLYIEGITELATIEICNTTGQKVLQTKIQNMLRLNINLTTGIYIATILTENGIIQKKLVIK